MSLRSKALCAFVRPDAEEQLHWMISNGWDINELLIAACMAPFETGVDVLLHQGADPDFGLRAAVDDERSGILRKLLVAGGNPDYGNKGKLAIILGPAHITYAEAVAELLAAGATPCVVDEFGRSPLHLASFPLVEGSPCTIRSLVEHGANLNMEDSNGSTPLHYAAEAGVKPLVDELLRLGAVVDAHDNQGRTPVERARIRWQALGDETPIVGPNPDWPAVIQRLTI